VLLEDCDLASARMLATKLLSAVREFRFMWQGRVFEIGVSIGVAPISALSGGRREILSAADAACYVAKELGRNRVHVYLEDDADLTRRRREMHWVSEIRQGMAENRFMLYRQAIVPVGNSAQEGEQHFEVLLRFVDSQAVITEPGMIINAAERYNLMVTIDRWVIDRVFRHLRDIFDEDPKAKQQRITYAINLSGTTLNDDQFSVYVEQLLRRYELPPERVCFEITETAAITNLGNASRLIRQLKDIGCSFALDDFGVGFSSYGYLKNLPIDYVKIDGHFVRDILEDPLDLAIVESINHIGNVIGIRTIAEWVESEAILDKVRQIGVDYAQGYALSIPEPMPQVVHA
jgi:EAL domain-containing protein (putative c-di-GMP-specific phosphodiesterase class I)